MEEGYVPEAVANYLCLLGWSPKDNREKLPMEEVVSLFELDKINRRNAAFDADKCFWLNGQYVARDVAWIASASSACRCWNAPDCPSAV